MEQALAAVSIIPTPHNRHSSPAARGQNATLCLNRQLLPTLRHSLYPRLSLADTMQRPFIVDIHNISPDSWL
jgi:hypothetical protein